MKTLCFFFVLTVLFPPSLEHGTMFLPAARQSAWRFGFDTPPNYTDNELNCGGISHQWITNGGKCGECGDPWDVPIGERPHQPGGLYATGTIVGHYSPGEIIDVVIHIDANHKGWYEFRLCPVNDPSVAATWQCLNETLLEFEDGSTRYYLPEVLGNITHHVRLPTHISCTQCVFQWLWHCGNNYGIFPNGTECIGCGPQEQFYSCADIAISGNIEDTTPEGTPGTTIPMTTNPTTIPMTTNPTTIAMTTDPTTIPMTTNPTTIPMTTNPTTIPMTTNPTTTTTSGPTTTTTQGTTTTRPEGEFDCKYTGDSLDQEAMDQWCNDNCNHEPCYCPSDCQCTPERPC